MRDCSLGEPLTMKYVHLELKVCEGCGVLWLRRKHNEDTAKGASVYCYPCLQRLSCFPPSGRHAGGRPRLHSSGRPGTRTARNRGCAAAKAGAR